MRKIVVLAIFILCLSCHENKPLFVKINSNNSNITFKNTLTNSQELNILNYLYFYNGSGVSAADFNNNGLTDLFFTSNQTADKLYLNKGGFIFEDITDSSGINNSNNWTTGSTTVDINNDGLLDIYICKVGDYNHIQGQNLLYVNQGMINGKLSFKESASSFGLDIVSFATQSAFFDYDLDGDLDMFLLNHSLHPNSNYGNGSSRLKPDKLSGDKLYENIDGKFVDVTLNSGILQSKIGYGLGVSISDLNNDGFPDIYVGNDFFENDYLYINQKDKTFKEVISTDKTVLGHTSHFSMGNSIDDINNDGNMDIVSLDMLPEDLKTYKTSGLEYPYQMYEYYLKNGYAPQYMQNTLHINNGNGSFSETAYLSGIAATEWSWSPLMADFDNDGYKDAYITNGILGATNDMDFINFISNESIQKQLGAEMSEKNLALANEIPPKKVKNYFFKNNKNNTFSNLTDNWAPYNETYSNGGVYVDLDNDGDLDIVVNNVNEEALILKNTSESKDSINNFLKIKFKGSESNKFGIGTKTKVYTGNNLIVEENYTTKGYLSSLEPKSHFGLGQNETIDSLEIIWSDGKHQILKDIKANQEIEVDYRNASGNYYSDQKQKTKSLLTNTDSLFEFKHTDQTSLEFNRDPLIPFASTNLGPSIGVTDINNDNLQDVLIGGGKGQPSQLFIQNEEGSFNSLQNDVFKDDSINEDTHHIFFDANNDQFKDLLIVSGGNEFKKGKALNPRLYLNNNGVFQKDSLQFKDVEINASKVTAVDIDNDGDQDISISSNLIPLQFGRTPNQYIFENDGTGNFKDISNSFAPELQTVGNVQDIVWLDLNNDNFKDAIVVGHWMPITIFLNDGKQLIAQKENNLEQTNGWWNSIKAADFDKDGDIDLITGNWGLNTRLKATKDQPITLYSNDYDDNSTVDPVITHYYQNIETPFASKDELAKQMPFLNKDFLSYKDFANAKFTDLLPKEKLKNAYKKQVFELGSCYFENLGNNTFKKVLLPFKAQVSSVNEMLIDDYNNDGFSDIFLTGNNYEISTQLGKLDASHGLVLINDKKGFFTELNYQNFDVSGPARDIKKIIINNKIYYIISINNGSPIFLKKSK